MQLLENTLDIDSLLFALVTAPTLFGIAHHVDHVIRGNHVGWPLTPEVNAFTYSLAIYPAVALGLYLTVTDRVDVGYWAGLLFVGFLLVALSHLGPWAVEPPTDVVGPYANPLAGYAAFAVLLALLASLFLGTAVAARRWYRA
jgi:hypothetical protein